MQQHVLHSCTHEAIVEDLEDEDLLEWIPSTSMGRLILSHFPTQDSIADTPIDLGALADVLRSAWAGLIPMQLTNMLAGLIAREPGCAGPRSFAKARTLFQKITGLTTSAICDIRQKRKLVRGSKPLSGNKPNRQIYMSKLKPLLIKECSLQ